MHRRQRYLIRRYGSGAASIAIPTIIATSLLVGAGVTYRFVAPRWYMSIDKHIELPVPLSKIPRQLGPWTGEEMEIEASTQIYMKKNFADDYVSLRYMNVKERLGADLYVVYCATRPAAIVGHQPRRCYPGNGWIWDRTTPSRIVTRSGRMVDCLVHHFHKPASSYQEVYVLNFYVLNGQITLSEKDFSGWLGRRPNLQGDPARYVAQVQISSLYENSAKALAVDAVDTILAFLPNKDGRVAAVDLFQ